MADKPRMRVALVGYAFMGAAHSQAWRNAHRFFDLPAVPELAVLCGRNASAAAAAAEKLGWQETATDWHEVVTRDDIDVVDVSSPGDTHRDIAIHHVRAQYLQDWIVDPEFPLVWRLQKDKAGSGALGDLGAHIVDLAAPSFADGLYV